MYIYIYTWMYLCIYIYTYIYAYTVQLIHMDIWCHNRPVKVVHTNTPNLYNDKQCYAGFGTGPFKWGNEGHFSWSAATQNGWKKALCIPWLFGSRVFLSKHLQIRFKYKFDKLCLVKISHCFLIRSLKNFWPLKKSPWFGSKSKAPSNASLSLVAVVTHLWTHDIFGWKYSTLWLCQNSYGKWPI